VVQTTSPEVTKTIESRDLTTLPVAERNYFRLLTLDSNVVARAPGTNGLYVGGGDVWNFGTYVDGTSNFSKWLTLQRAPQRRSGARSGRLPFLAVAIAGQPLQHGAVETGQRARRPATARHRLHLDEQLDTIQNTLTSVVSDRLLNEVRGQWSRYYDLRAAK